MKNHGHARQITKTSTPPSSIIFNAGAISVKVSVCFLWHQLVQVRSCEVEYQVYPMESRDVLTTLYRHCRCMCKIIHIHHSTGSTDPWTNSTHPGLKSKDNARVLSSSFNRFSSNSVWCWCFSWTQRPRTNQMTTNEDCLIFGMLMITIDDVDDDLSSLYHYEETGSHTMNSWLHKKQDLVYLLDSVANLSNNTWYIYIYIFYVNKVYIYICKKIQRKSERERGREKKRYM